MYYIHIYIIVINSTLQQSLRLNLKIRRNATICAFSTSYRKIGFWDRPFFRHDALVVILAVDEHWCYLYCNTVSFVR